MRKLFAIPTALALVALSAGPVGSATTVQVKDDFFSPRVNTIKKGQTVTFRWAGRARHNVKGGGLNSRLQRSGTYRAKFNSKRTVNYVCTVHPGMKGSIRVT